MPATRRRPRRLSRLPPQFEPVEVIVDGASQSVFLRHEDGDSARFDQIVAMELTIAGVVAAGPPIQLTHRKIGDQKTAYGTTVAGEDPAVLVVVDDGQGEAAYLRVRRAGEPTARDIPLKTSPNRLSEPGI